MSQPLVSVVTPVYNGEEYLAECIDSVLAQTYPHWRYVIVNNCSTDRSLQIALDYARRDRRIEVVDNDVFLEQVPNLNKAMTCIAPESKYAKMLLADDWMFPNCLAEMVAVAEEHPEVGLVTSYRLDDTRVNCDGLPYPSRMVDGRSICRASLLEDLFVFGSPSTVMIRSDLVRRRVPFYSESSLHEDTEACYDLLEEHALGFVHQVLTFTRRQNESLTSVRRAIDPQHRLDKLIIAVKYGPRFLDETEYAQCLARLERAYYEFLADRSLYRVPSGFWAYHRDGMESAGYRFRRGLFARLLAGRILAQLAHPRQLGARMAGWVRRAVHPPSGSSRPDESHR